MPGVLKYFEHQNNDTKLISDRRLDQINKRLQENGVNEMYDDSILGKKVFYYIVEEENNGLCSFNLKTVVDDEVDGLIESLSKTHVFTGFDGDKPKWKFK